MNVIPPEPVVRAAPPVSPRRRALSMAALMSAAVLAALDTTIANTALPQIARDLHAGEAAIIWVANAYQIAMIAGILPFSAWGESHGYRGVFIGGLLLFAAASAVCGGATTLAVLVAGRAAQGIGAAAIMSVITALIRHIYPPGMLGRGIGTNALVVALGFTLGPIVASTVLAVAAWHWLFLINVPIALVSIALSLRYLPHAAGGRHRFDAPSALLCAAGIGLPTMALCVLDNGGNVGFGLSAAALGASCLWLLLRKQRGHPAPMLAIDLLGIRTVRLSSLTSICAFATQSLALVSLPFFLQGTLGVSIVGTGFLLAAWPLLVALMALVAAPLSDRGKIAPGLLCGIGLIALATGMSSLAMLRHDASEIGVALRLALCGAGFGLFQSPNLREIMSKSPASRSGAASALVALSRLLGQTSGAALVAQSFHLRHAAGPVMSLWLGAACAFLGSIFSVMRLRTGSPSPHFSNSNR